MSIKHFSLTAVGFACAVMLLLRAFYIPASGFDDPDFFWHIRYGQWILEHGQLPTEDIFSWSRTGEPYLLTQWGGEILMALAYNSMGLSGTNLLSVALAGIFIGFSYLSARRYVHPAVAMTLVGLCAITILLVPMRPQMFSFALLAVAAWMCLSWFDTRNFKYLLPYPFLIALWVNLHGGFIVGLGLLALIVIGLTLESMSGCSDEIDSTPWITDRLTTCPAWQTPFLAFVGWPAAVPYLVLCASILAAMINPYGFEAINNVFHIAGLKSSARISEWQPVMLTSKVGGFYLLMAIPYLAAILLSEKRPRLTYALIGAAFLVFGYLANRQVMMCAAVTPPILAEIIGKTPNYKAMLPSFRNPRMHVLVLVGILSLGVFRVVHTDQFEEARLAANTSRYPVAATAYILENKLGEKVMSDTIEASWLIRHGLPVFIDGRMDFYGDDFFFAWRAALEGKASWQSLLDEYRPTALLLENDSALRQLAVASGKWSQEYSDQKFSVLVARKE